MDQNIIWRYIETLKSTNRSIFVTTQKLEEAQIISDRIGVLSSNGNLVVSGRENMVMEYFARNKGWRLRLEMKALFREAMHFEYVEEKVEKFIKRTCLYKRGWHELVYHVPTSCKKGLQVFLDSLAWDKIFNDIIQGFELETSPLKEVIYGYI